MHINICALNAYTTRELEQYLSHIQTKIAYSALPDIERKQFIEIEKTLISILDKRRLQP